MIGQRTSEGDLKTTRRAWVRNQAEFRMQALREDRFNRAAKLFQSGNDDPDSRARVQFEFAPRPQGRVSDFLRGVGKRESVRVVTESTRFSGEHGYVDTCRSQRGPQVFLPWVELIEAEDDNLFRKLGNPRAVRDDRFKRGRSVDPALLVASCGEALGPSVKRAALGGGLVLRAAPRQLVSVNELPGAVGQLGGGAMAHEPTAGRRVCDDLFPEGVDYILFEQGSIGNARQKAIRPSAAQPCVEGQNVRRFANLARRECAPLGLVAQAPRSPGIRGQDRRSGERQYACVFDISSLRAHGEKSVFGIYQNQRLRPNCCGFGTSSGCGFCRSSE